MKRRCFARFSLQPLLLLMLLVVLSACGSSEDKARTKYAEAQQMEQAGKVQQATGLYQGLIGEFPQTPAARQAEQRLELLQRQQQQALGKTAFEMLNSIHLVVEGYHSLFRDWPKTAGDFDKEEYLFDSDYMAETVADGFTLYLTLPGSADYLLWTFPDAGPVAYSLNEKKRSIIEVEKATALERIKADYRIDSKKGGMVFLAPRT